MACCFSWKVKEAYAVDAIEAIKNFIKRFSEAEKTDENEQGSRNK